MNYRDELASRVASRRSGLLDVRSELLHFALITYALPSERLRPHIHGRFEIPTFRIRGEDLALMSAVPFVDRDFCFHRVAPFLKMGFAQTNYRVYVIDGETGEHCVWFFGTSLGSLVVHVPRLLWRIPWHSARYEVECSHSPSVAGPGERRRYDRYRITARSRWAPADIELEDTGLAMTLLDGFESLEQQALILTHPVSGYYYRLDGKLGTYSVWHDEIPLSMGAATRLNFGLFEHLGLLSRGEMQQPHSVLICPRTEFEVHLPPRRVATRPSMNVP